MVTPFKGQNIDSKMGPQSDFANLKIIMSCRDEHVETSGHDHSHSHGHGHDHDDHDHSKPEDAEGDSLYPYIDIPKLRCLNAEEAQHVHFPFKPHYDRRDREKFLDSQEDDPELILFIPFTEAVSIRSICISGGQEGTSPKEIKLFANRDDIDFSNASDLPGLQKIELAEDFLAEIDYPVQQRKFQGVSNITVFIPECFAGDQTRVYYIGLKGESKKWKHGVVECVYESQAQRSDHKVPDTANRNLA